MVRGAARHVKSQKWGNAAGKPTPAVPRMPVMGDAAIAQAVRVHGMTGGPGGFGPGRRPIRWLFRRFRSRYLPATRAAAIHAFFRLGRGMSRPSRGAIAKSRSASAFF